MDEIIGTIEKAIQEMQKLEIQSTFNNMARIINSINAMYAARDFITDLKKKNVETYGGDQ